MHFVLQCHTHLSNTLQGQNTENIVGIQKTPEKVICSFIFKKRTQTQNPVGIGEMVSVAVYRVIYTVYY